MTTTMMDDDGSYRDFFYSVFFIINFISFDYLLFF